MKLTDDEVVTLHKIATTLLFSDLSEDKEDYTFKIPNYLLDKIYNHNNKLKKLSITLIDILKNKWIKKPEKDTSKIDKDKIYKREMIQRVKCLCLLKMNKSIFTNTLSMSLRERGKLQKLMWEYNDIDHKIIIEEFNEKIGEILDDSEFDISKVPIYQYK
jgi:hypothetical protein